MRERVAGRCFCHCAAGTRRRRRGGLPKASMALRKCLCLCTNERVSGATRKTFLENDRHRHLHQRPRQRRRRRREIAIARTIDVGGGDVGEDRRRRRRRSGVASSLSSDRVRRVSRDAVC